MNKEVSFPLAKLLKEKQWQIPTLCYYFEDGELIQNTYKDTTGMDYGSEFQVEFSELTENWNNGWLSKKNGNRCFGCSKSNGYFETFSAPTIAEVVMWFYDKHRIWIWVGCRELEDGTNKTIFIPQGRTIPSTKNDGFVVDIIPYTPKGSPTEAYEAGIEYTLNHII